MDLCSEESVEKKLNLDKIKKNESLVLYALGAQGSIGDVSGDKPNIFQPVRRSKYEAWEKIKGMNMKAA